MKNIKLKSITLIVLSFIFLLSTAGCIITIEEPETPTEPTESTASQTPVVPIDPGWSGSTFVDNTQALPSIADVVEQVVPSVVTITTEVVTLDIFQNPRTQSGAGSGWVFREDGIIVTNNHVVEGAEKVTVELSDGRTYQASPDKVFRDPVTDLAIVKINANGLPALGVANSNQLMPAPARSCLAVASGTVAGGSV